MNEIKLDTLINKFITKIIKKHPIKLLKNLFVYRFLIYLNVDNNLVHKDKTILTGVIDYLISIYQSTNIKEDVCSEIDIDYIEDVILLFEEIYSLYRFLDKSFEPESKVTSIKDNTSGITYPIVLIEIINNILLSQENMILETYGVDHLFLMKELVELTYKLRTLPEPVEFDNQGLTFQKLIEMVPDTYFDLKSNTNLPIKLLKDFSQIIGEHTDYLKRKEYRGWPNIDSPGKFRPLIEYENGIYIFSHNLFFDNLYRNIQRSITKNNKYKITNWNLNQQQNSEWLVENILKIIFNDAKYFNNNFYYKSKSHRLENDLLIIDNDLLLVVEVKAGSFSYKSSITDSESHEKSIESLVEKPQMQVENFIESLKSNEKLTIFDEERKPKKTISIKDFNIIIGLTVTIDHFNEITATYYNSENERITALPISIYDLYILTIYFENKFDFVHYLLFRMSNFAPDMLIVEELVFLEMYIINHHANKMLIDEKNKLNAGLILTDSSVEMIDKYFEDYPFLSKSNKPLRRIYGEIKTILRILLKKEGNIFSAATTLLEPPYEFQRNLIRGAKQKSKLGLKDKQFHFERASDNNVQFILGYIDKKRIKNFNFNDTFNKFNKEFPYVNNVLICLIYDIKKDKILDVLFKSKFEKV